MVSARASLAHTYVCVCVCVSQVKAVEKTTNHDVKAVEYVLKEHFRKHQELEKVRDRTPAHTHTHTHTHTNARQ